MKKLVLTLGICLVAAVCFGQKKNVAEALKLAKDTKPNFTEARAKIKAALQHEETKNDAKTWFTAGQIENLQFDAENTKQILGQQPNEAVMYAALFDLFPYFEKAYELDKLPDAKGKVKPKFTKDMKAILKTNLPYYINGGAYFVEQVKDYKKAFEFFDQFVVVSDSPLMKDGEVGVAVADSNYMYANYYAAIFASEYDPQVAIKALTRASKQDFKKNDMLQYLSQTYDVIGDKENYEKALVEGFTAFPKEPYFLINLVNVCLDAERHDKALEYALVAISNDPNSAILHNVAGFIYERSPNGIAKAEEHYKKSIEIDGENAETQSNLGRIFYNQGVAQLDIANEIADVKKYTEEKEKAKSFFRKAMPYYEKAFELNAETLETKIALRGIYYNLDMGDKLSMIEKLMEE